MHVNHFGMPQYGTHWSCWAHWSIWVLARSARSFWWVTCHDNTKFWKFSKNGVWLYFKVALYQRVLNSVTWGLSITAVTLGQPCCGTKWEKRLFCNTISTIVVVIVYFKYAIRCPWVVEHWFEGSRSEQALSCGHVDRSVDPYDGLVPIGAVEFFRCGIYL